MLRNLSFHFSQYGILYGLLVFGTAVIGTASYVTYNRVTTRYTCLANGYASSHWDIRLGGLCSRVENGNTVLVKVGHLTSKN